MRATREMSEHRLARIRWARRHTGFMTPLPVRRERRYQPPERASEWETWWGREAHPEIHRPLRQIAVLILWVLVVMGMILHEHHKLYPVRENGQLLGYVTPLQIKQLPRAEWPRRRVAEIMASDVDRVEITPETDALAALARMQRSDQTRLLVVDHGSLVGIVTLKDLLDFLSLKLELEEA